MATDITLSSQSQCPISETETDETNAELVYTANSCNADSNFSIRIIGGGAAMPSPAMNSRGTLQPGDATQRLCSFTLARYYCYQD